MNEALKTIEELQKFTNLSYASIIVEDKEEILKFANQENLRFSEPCELAPYFSTSKKFGEMLVTIKTKDLKAVKTVTFKYCF